MSDQNTKYQNIEVEDAEKSQKKISGEVPAEQMETKRGEALERLAQTIEVDGFRKGNVPTDVAEKHLGENAIMEEAANIALSEAYPEILQEHGIQAIGRPQIQVTKLAKGSPLGFTITTAVVPDVKLPDYKKIAQEELAKQDEESTDVTDDELDETIQQVKKNVAMQRKMEAQQNFGQGDGQQPEEPSEDELPELTDEFVQSLGDFKDVEDFKTKLRENLKQEKERKNKEKKRQAVAERLINEATIDVPDVVVDSELDKMVAQFKDDIQRAGMEFDQYLEKLGKKEDELRGEWRENAEKKAKMQLILNKIASDENITPGKEAMDHQVQQLKEQYPDAPEENIRTYVETYMTNEEVLKFLENQTTE